MPWPNPCPVSGNTVKDYMDSIDPHTERAVRLYLSLIASHYNIAGAIVYGSRARGTHRVDSDADVAVILRGNRQDFWAVTMDMAGIAFDVLLETDIFVSPLPIWLDEWVNPECYSNPALLRNIRREGVRL